MSYESGEKVGSTFGAILLFVIFTINVPNFYV